MIEPILVQIAGSFFNSCRGSMDQWDRQWQRHQQILRRADHFLHAHLAEPFDLDSLASASGVTTRTIQREFATAYGMPPHKWARCLSLHRARQRLKTPEAKRLTVEAIALECGFRHMGRFSRYYAELFGESPSKTLLPGRTLGASAGQRLDF